MTPKWRIGNFAKRKIPKIARGGAAEYSVARRGEN